MNALVHIRVDLCNMYAYVVNVRVCVCLCDSLSSDATNNLKL